MKSDPQKQEVAVGRDEDGEIFVSLKDLIASLRVRELSSVEKVIQCLEDYHTLIEEKQE